MVNISTIRKIVLVIFLTTLVAMPFVSLNCSTVELSNTAPMCRMQVFAQAKTQLEQIKQLMIAIINDSNYLFILLAVVIFSAVLLVFQSSQSYIKTNIEFFVFNMKPWDSFRFAMARGIIHNENYS